MAWPAEPLDVEVGLYMAGTVGPWSVAGGRIIASSGREFVSAGFNGGVTIDVGGLGTQAFGGPSKLSGSVAWAWDGLPGNFQVHTDIWPGDANLVGATEVFPGGHVTASPDQYAQGLNSGSGGFTSLPDRVYALTGARSTGAIAAGIAAPADHWHARVYRVAALCRPKSGITWNTASDVTAAHTIPQYVARARELVDLGLVVSVQHHGLTGSDIELPAALVANPSLATTDSSLAGSTFDHLRDALDLLDALCDEFAAEDDFWLGLPNEPHSVGVADTKYRNLVKVFVARARANLFGGIIVVPLAEFCGDLGGLATGAYDTLFDELDTAGIGHNLVVEWHQYGKNTTTDTVATYAETDAQLTTIRAGGRYAVWMSEYGQATPVGTGSAGPDAWNREAVLIMATDTYGEPLGRKHRHICPTWWALADGNFDRSYSVTYGPANKGNESGADPHAFPELGTYPWWDVTSEALAAEWLTPGGQAHWDLAHSIWQEPAGTWVDVVTTGDGVRHRDEIFIRHGRSDWASIADPSQASFTLANRDGRWSPDNPDGPWHGLFRRNIPCRIGIGRGEIHMAPTTVSYDLASTPDHASLDVAGNLDVRIEFEGEKDLVDIDHGGSIARLVHKSTGTTGWGLSIYDDGGIIRAAIGWYDPGAVFRTYHTGNSGAELPADFRHEHRALRAVLTNSTGNLTWYTATTLAGPWTQLGSPCTGVGATSIAATTAPLKVGGVVGDNRIPYPGRIYDFELRDGTTLVAAAAFNDQTVGATSWTDSAGRLWTIGPGGRITNMLWRFHGELSSIPTRWNIDGSDVWAPVEATGLFRRLRQGNRRLDSSLRRGLLAQANNSFGSDLVAYWPMEETGRDLTAFGAAVGGGPMTIAGDTPTTGANSAFHCSEDLPTLGNSVLTADVATYSPATEWQVRWLQHIPSDATSGGAWFEVLRISTTGHTWIVQWQDTSGGNMRVLAYNSSGTLVYTGGAIGMAATGQPFRVSLAISTNGSNVDLDFQAQIAGGVPGGVIVTNAVAGVPGRVTQLKFNKDANLDEWAIGHVTVQNNVTPTTELYDELNAHNGERAAARIVRLCREEGIATRIEGSPSDTHAMGYQRPATLMGLLEECAATDLGILHESRETVAVGYRTRASMIGQPVIVALDYAAGDVARSIDLDRDDDGFANDVTLTNQSGATARAVLDDASAMSISEPPVGAGRYQTSASVNLWSDTDLPYLAAGYLALSSVDEPRVSALTIGLHHAAPSADAALTATVFDMSLGDRVDISNPLDTALGAAAPAISQLIQGWRERINLFEHELVLNTTPASPWATNPVTDPPAPTFPMVESITPSATNAPNTSHSILLDDLDSPGELLLAFCVWNADTTVTFPGWTALSSDTSSPGRSAIYGKIASGSEGSSVAVTTSTSQAGAFEVIRISNNKGGLVAGTDYSVAVAAAATTANPNPPSVTAGWGSEDNLFIAGCMVRGDNDAVTGFPTSYEQGTHKVTTNGGGGGATVGVAVRQLTSATDDPDAFTLSASEYGRAYTIVIRPA